MKLICYELQGHTADIQPSPVRREWMDNTHKRTAYKCLPLLIANSHGWEIRCPAAFEAVWDGGKFPNAIQLYSDAEQDPDSSIVSSLVASHFGSGILTFAPTIMLRTPPGLNLWVSGPTNKFKDGIQAMSAAIETDWMPFTFTMNWKFTRTGQRIRFERGEPFCFFFPISRGLVEQCEPRFGKLEEEDEDLEKKYLAAFHGRRSKADDPWYMKGEEPDGSAKRPEHQTKIRARPFVRDT